MLGRILILFFSICFCISSNAQTEDRAPVQVGPVQVYGQEKVGVVLSGGGASGLSHIGVLKALEENHIPIDYICGTSMGALVACMYAQGLTPVEMQNLVESEEFMSWATGIVQPDNIYFFKKKEDDASWVTFKLNVDTTLSNSLPTNVISPVQLDFALMERTAAAAAAANYNFDSLFIPFRCVASDVVAKQSIIFKTGDLGEAVRASMSYPFYLKPISVDGKLLFDGGLYNNFPSNVMYQDFFPDFIIGSNVASEFQNPDEDNLLSQIRAMLTSKSDFNPQCENGIVIEPDADWLGLFAFDNAQRIIDSGYAATIRKIDEIKLNVVRRSDPLQLANDRAAFLAKEPKIIFDSISIEGKGMKRRQVAYVNRLLRHKEKIVPIDKLKPDYFRLAADDKIKSVFPKAHYNKSTGYYSLRLDIRKEKKISTEFGGNISSRPINMGFVGFRYDILSNPSITLSGNAYFGKLYSSAQIRARVDFPFKIPFYLEPIVTWNRWDYFHSSAVYFIDTKPAYLINIDRFAEMDAGFPVHNKGRVVIGSGFAANRNLYYQTDAFTSIDTADKTDFNLLTSHIKYERNTLNRKQFASAGTYLSLEARFVQGEELYDPGTTSPFEHNFRTVHNWMQFRVTYDTYFKERGRWRLGFYAQIVYTTQPFSERPFFHNYTATMLACPAFEPTPESQTYFIPAFRAHQFIGSGLKSIFVIAKNIDFRIEGYLFAPYQKIVENPNHTASYASPPAFNFQYIKTLSSMAMAAAVWTTPLGPVSVSLNYYSPQKQPFSLLFNFGYIIFNRKTLE
jgi:NTE family protein